MLHCTWLSLTSISSSLCKTPYWSGGAFSSVSMSSISTVGNVSNGILAYKKAEKSISHFILIGTTITVILENMKIIISLLFLNFSAPLPCLLIIVTERKKDTMCMIATNVSGKFLSFTSLNEFWVIKLSQLDLSHPHKMFCLPLPSLS